MPAPSSSYVTEVDYPAGFSPNQAPVHLGYVCALNGVKGPDPAGAYRYCEIGCGTGKTVNVLAAANPDAEFLGIDINPRHIDEALTLARGGELSNARFLAADIAGPEVGDLPTFDFITLHGVYAWVAPAVRRAIRDFIAEKLSPGGVVYLSYNALPGWGGIAQMQRYFHERAARSDGEPVEVAKVILDELETLREKKAPFFLVNPSAGAVLEQIRKQDLRYVVHEFLAGDWCPMAFADVAGAMAAAGLAYVGDAQIIENFVDHAVPEEFPGFLKAIPDRMARESAKDFITNRFFRADVYMRSSAAARQAAAGDRLGSVLFGTEKTSRELADTIEICDGRVKIEGAYFDRLKDILAAAPLSLDDITERCDLAGGRPEPLVEALKLLTAGRQLLPFARRGEALAERPWRRVSASSPLNRLLLREPLVSSVVVASPVAGTGIRIEPFEACLLLALESDDPVSTALTELERRRVTLKRGDAVLETEAAQREALAKFLPQFASHKAPKLAALGVVELCAS